MSFSASCMMRGLLAALIVPKFGLLTVVRGAPRLAWLNTLKKLAAELHAEAFDDVKEFEKRVVQVPLAGGAQLRALGAAESADGVRPENGSVEPPCDNS
jgi:hypothetical protein